MAKTPATDSRQASVVALSLMAVVIGVVAGLGAIFLRMLISVIHNLFFLGELSLHYEANEPTLPGPFGPFVILAPVVGGLIVVFLVKRYAPEAKGHGVPEVMDAIYYKAGRVRPAVVIIKSLASALSIGSGASVGREGPIIQIGSGMGSVLGQVFHLRTSQVITLVAAGAGAGIAATFNTPLGAVLFAVELMLPEFTSRTLLPLVLATGTATYMGRLAFGMEPAFLVATYERPEIFVPLSVDMLPLYVLFGLIAGLAGTLFVKALYWTEDLFDGMKVNDYVKNVIAMTSLGVLFYVLLLTTGMYHTQGVGYATIQLILTGQLTAPGFLMLLFVLKMAATSISLGGGASGGVFSPSLFLGAALGASFGALLNMAFPFLGFNTVTFALIGMAAIVGSSTGAAITSIIMLFEMTGDYSITVAAIIAVACAVGVRTGLSPQDIYTTKLARRGHHIPHGLRSHMFGIRMARTVMRPVVGTMEAAAVKPPAMVRPAGDVPASYVVVTEGRSITGVVEVDPEQPTRTLGPILSPVGVVRETSFLESVMSHMADRGHKAVLVIPEKRMPRAENVVGVLTRDAIGEVVMRDYRS
ncbi:chloride channel protein [Acidimangrovimonas pyrenivorans]|uniref:Chloride channel protein n=1 Tax=Acidimangrovimonas pyrenivorans TaxID=2030798 RepID=A0ABV7AI15_9RHOB